MAKEKIAVETITSVHRLWDNILLIPIFGIIDSKRAQDITEAMLTKILETQYKTIILDIIGVMSIDSAVANNLIKMTKATKLMGCECIITNIHPTIAQTMVNLGIDLGNIVTKATLKDGVAYAFSSLGLEVVKTKEIPLKKV